MNSADANANAVPTPWAPASTPTQDAADGAWIAARVRAGRRLVPMALVLFVLGVVVGLLPALRPLWLVALASSVVALVVDLVWLRGRAPVTVTRAAPRVLALGQWHDISLTLQSTRRTALQIDVADHPMADRVESQFVEQRVTVNPHRQAVLQWRVRPRERGPLRFEPAHVLVPGPFGLLQRHDRLGGVHEASVYPDFAAVATLSGLAPGAMQGGSHLRRRRGHGSEFHQLRDYMEGDPPRHIDWRAVARGGRMISREFREERNQRVVFLLDCGRRMRARDGDLSLLDRTLNALLLLSHVALRQGDAVSVVTFGGVDRWLPETRGPHGIRQVVRAIHDVQPTLAASDFQEAVQRTLARQRRRALVVVLTNLGDDDCEDLPRILAPMMRRHVVMVGSLRDPVLAEVRAQEPTTLDAALTAAATLDYLADREDAHRSVAKHGVQVLDVEPAALPRAIVERYLRFKRAGVL